MKDADDKSTVDAFCRTCYLVGGFSTNYKGEAQCDRCNASPSTNGDRRISSKARRAKRKRQTARCEAATASN